MAVTIVAKKSPRHIDWERAKEQWVRANLDGTLTLEEFAKQIGRTYGRVRNVSYKNGWMDELRRRQKIRDEEVIGQVEKRQEEALDRVRAEYVNQESEVRRRHATLGRAMQVAASRRLASIQPEELSVREAVLLLSTGTEMERRALGISGADVLPLGAGEDFDEVAEEIKRQEGLRKLGARLIEFANGRLTGGDR